MVRLRRGDPAWETVYGDDPCAVALRWKEEGARWVHVVNLDGALGKESSENLRALERILETGLRVQFGGGLRDLEAIRQTLRMGVARAVLGTVAVYDPRLVRAIVEEFGPERIACALDVRSGEVCVRGWQEEVPLSPEDLARRWALEGVRWLIFTDVARDGTEAGLNVEAAAALAQKTGMHVIASGGVAGPEDVWRARRAGLSGVILGRALYEGRVSLRQLLEARNGDEASHLAPSGLAGTPLSDSF